MLAAPFRSICVLRFAPVFDAGHLRDVAKRVYLPGTPVKLRLYPPPMHSLCSLERAVMAVVDAAEGQLSGGASIVNVADLQSFSQHELVGWFPGPALPVPVPPLRWLGSLSGLCGTTGRSLARLIDKFISSTVSDLQRRSPKDPACQATEET